MAEGLPPREEGLGVEKREKKMKTAAKAPGKDRRTREKSGSSHNAATAATASTNSKDCLSRAANANDSTNKALAGRRPQKNAAGSNGLSKSRSDNNASTKRDAGLSSPPLPKMARPKPGQCKVKFPAISSDESD